MNEQDKELFDGIIDVPKAPTPNNNINQNNLEYNFNFETQTKPEPVINREPVKEQAINQQNIYNQNPSSNQFANSQAMFGDNQVSNVNIYSNSRPQSEILNTNTVGNNLEAPQNNNVKEIDHEALASLNKDTESFVNPSLIVNPSVRSLEQPTEVLEVEEPTVNYKEIKTKKNYVFMAIVFAILIIFIIFLPKIAAWIGI